MIYRDNNLLALAQGEPCLLRATRHCLGSEGSTTVSAHSNELRHGKGRSIKAEDVYSVWACYPCHTWLDQGSGGFEAKTQAWSSGRTPISSRRLSLNLKRGIHERFRSGTHKDGGRHSRSRRVCLGVQLRSLPNQVHRMEGNI